MNLFTKLFKSVQKNLAAAWLFTRNKTWQLTGFIKVNLLKIHPAHPNSLTDSAVPSSDDAAFSVNAVEPNPLTPQEIKLRERKRRRLELGAATVLIMIVVAVTVGQLYYFGDDSWLFMALLNINALLMLVVLFLVARNVVKLVLERRRKVFGSRLRTRLVLAFVSLSLIPIVIMFLAANRVVATSVDYWFTNQVENSMQAALQVGQSFYTAAATRLHDNAKLLLEEVDTQRLRLGSQEMDKLLSKRQRETGLTLLGFVSREATQPPTYTLQHWHSQPGFMPIWTQIQQSIDWDHVSRSGSDSLLWGDASGDYVISVLPMGPGQLNFFVSAEAIGKGLLKQLGRISQGFEEYTQIKNLKKPLKLSFSMVLGLLGLIIIFGSVWIGFRLSRQLTEPILALSRGTAQLAKGDLDFQLEDTGKDELGQLVTSFNRMALDVRESRENLTQLNSLLEQRSQILTQRNQYIETVLEYVAAGVVTLNSRGQVLTMNKAACSIFSTIAMQLQGKNPAFLLAPEHNALFIDMLASLHKHPQRPWQKEVEFTSKGRHWKLLIHAVALPAQGMEHEVLESLGSIVAVIEDITELARMQRFSAWREVAQRIAHEIKNPLTPIKLSAQRLERKFSAQVIDPAFSQCTSLIVKEVERMQNMVTEFSTFASLPEVSLKTADISPLLEEIVTLFRASHSRINWILELPTSPALPCIRFDAEALHRAFLNILGNAADALAQTPQPQVSIRAELSALPTGNLVIFVQDNGPGLDEEESSRLFEPYFSKKSGGTGLGLAIVRSIMNDHAATISANNIPTGGTCIRMEFPLV